MRRHALWFLGLVLVLVATWVHGLTATAGESLPALYAVLIFLPAPVVYIWLRFRRSWPSLWSRLGQTYVVAAVALSVVVLSGVGWLGSERTIHPRPSTGEPTLDEYRLPVEPVEFRVPDGTRRVGWFIPGSDGRETTLVAAGVIPPTQPAHNPRATVLLLSGYGGSKAGMLRHANFLHHLGFNTLLFDFRNRGESEGDSVTVGYFEQDDALAALSYLKIRPDVDRHRIGVLGTSMGAATAIMVAAKTNDLSAVVADSAFKSVESVVGQSFEHFISLPPFPYAPITLQILEWRTGIKTEDIVPLNVVDQISPRPLFLIHGTADMTFSYEASEALFAQASEPKELWIIPDAGHTQGIRKVPQEYEARVGAFFDRHLK